MNEQKYLAPQADEIIEFVKRQLKEHWGKKLSYESLEDWKDDLSGFNFFKIRKSFGDYRRDLAKKYPPTSMDIRRTLFESAKNISHTSSITQCCFNDCKNFSDERVGEISWMCKTHYENFMSKQFPDSTLAHSMKIIREKESEMKNLGMKGKQYFEHCCTKKVLTQKSETPSVPVEAISTLMSRATETLGENCPKTPENTEIDFKASTRDESGDMYDDLCYPSG